MSLKKKTRRRSEAELLCDLQVGTAFIDHFGVSRTRRGTEYRVAYNTLSISSHNNPRHGQGTQLQLQLQPQPSDVLSAQSEIPVLSAAFAGEGRSASQGNLLHDELPQPAIQLIMRFLERSDMHALLASSSSVRNAFKLEVRSININAVPTEGLLKRAGRVYAHVKDITITMPQYEALNFPSSADRIGPRVSPDYGFSHIVSLTIHNISCRVSVAPISGLGALELLDLSK